MRSIVKYSIYAKGEEHLRGQWIKRIWCGGEHNAFPAKRHVAQSLAQTAIGGGAVIVEFALWYLPRPIVTVNHEMIVMNANGMGQITLLRMFDLVGADRDKKSDSCLNDAAMGWLLKRANR